MKTIFLLLALLPLAVSDIVPPKAMPIQGPPPPPAHILEQRNLGEKIAARYKVPQRFAQDVVKYAQRYQHTTFPKTVDILSFIGIESEFNPRAQSKLSYDPAYGLTQIRPLTWKHMIKPGELHVVENQVKRGAEIMQQYYKILGDREGTVAAFNIGLTAYMQGRYKEAAKRYTAKFRREHATYAFANKMCLLRSS
jgi:hypothetical protein